MGYRVDRRADLVLTDMDGAVVDVLIGVPIGDVMEYDAIEGVEESWAKFLELATPTWNLEDAHGAIPVAAESFTRLPVPVIRAILHEWREAVVNPPAPLPPQSSDTAT